MIYRVLMALVFSLQASETSLLLQGKYREAGQAFERMELQEYVRPGISGARALQLLSKHFPSDREFLKRELAPEPSRLRALERTAPDRYQVTMLDGRTFAITPGPRTQTIKVDGKVVRVRSAPEFIADMRVAVGGPAFAWFGLFAPERAEAILNFAATGLLIVALAAYSAWSEGKENKKPTTEEYLAQLTNDCRGERDAGETPFHASRTAARLQASIESHVVPASLVKMDCQAYVKSMVGKVSAEQIRAGDPKRTCEQLESYRDCLELYKMRQGGERIQRANDGDSTIGR